MQMKRSKISFGKILDVIAQHLDDLDISSYSKFLDFEYAPASIKKIVEGGIYFIVDGTPELMQSIHNSVILTNRAEDSFNNNILFVLNNPQLVHYKLTALLDEPPMPGIHPTAIVSEYASIHPSAYIGPYCCIGEAVISENVCLLEHVVIKDHVTIGRGTVIDAGTSVGVRGMAWIWDDNGHRVMQPQLGGVVIGERCTIGSNISIVRGSLSENTVIGDGTVIAHGSMIGHGAQIGRLVHFANNVSLAGNARIGDRVFLGSSCVVSSNVSVEEGCIVGAGSVVTKSFSEKNTTIAGVPAQVLKRDNFNSKPSGVPKPYNNQTQ
jgi:UDP-3-O-[3-hydroxymyristoyl] glucosamine N-acyltransferase